VKKLTLGVGLAVVLCSAQVARADENPFTFALHGFVGFSMYAQDAQLGLSEGQHGMFAVKGFDTDKLLLGGDVRQSRFNFSVAGPKVFGGATPKGVLEIDFFGGFGAGASGDVSLFNRLRAVYVELDYGANRFAFGQMNDLIFTIAPTSLSHIAQPVGYFAGNVGWRRPAVWGFHTFGVGDGPKTEFAWEIGRSQWSAGGTAGSNNYGAPNNAYASLSESSGLPAVEARLTLAQGKAWSLFTTGHWNKVDENGIGVKGGPTLDVIAWNVGGKVVAGPLTLQATGYTGKNVATLIGNFAVAQSLKFTATGPTAGVTHDDIHAMGGWAQLGFNFTKEFSAWFEMGTDKPNADDVRKASEAGVTGAPGRGLQNVTTAAMLQYRDGGMAVGLEYFHFHTKYTSGAAVGTFGPIGPAVSVKGDQLIASANYFF